VALHAYLLSFVKKTLPLVDVVGQQAQAESEFDVLWSEGKIDGWKDTQQGPTPTAANGTGEGIWCAACS
jgi:splicing factor 3A subunit 3